MTTVLQSLNESLHQLMAADDRIVVLGQDLLDPYGGAFKVTRGLSSRFPERVFTTPVSEAAIVGLAAGLAMRGLRPVAEIMFGDFLFLAGDQIVNHTAKFRWMYNDAVTVPLVIRAPMGARRGYGPTHSQSVEKHFMGIPGLWIVAPHVLSAPGDLLRQATVDCDEPVVFIESKTCYPRPIVDAPAGTTCESIADALSPFPTVHVKHVGAAKADAVLWCYGGMVPHAIDAVQQLRDVEGLHVDLVAVSQLSPVPSSHIRRIVEATSPTLSVYVEEASVPFGWGSEMLAQVDASIESEAPSIRHERIGAADTPIPSSRELERAMLPQVSDIVTRIVECF